MMRHDYLDRMHKISAAMKRLLASLPPRQAYRYSTALWGTQFPLGRETRIVAGCPPTASDHQSDRMLDEMPERREQLRPHGAVYDAVIA